MSRKIRVSGACQTGGIIDALSIMLTSDDISRLDHRFPGKEEEFDTAIREADVWLTTNLGFTPPKQLLLINPNLKILQWPQIFFPAFHPDITQAQCAGHDITSLGCVYNSSICLWGWKNRVPIDLVLRLFRAETFDALGYLDRWVPSVAQLRKDFVECDLNFDQFILPVKRQGVFMHSNSHAKRSPIVHIARQLASKLGASRRIIDEPLEYFLSDTLIFDSVWPVYPEIADALSVPGCYRWKYRGTHCDGLDNFVEKSYTGYENQSIDRSILTVTGINDAFDRILHRQLELVA